MFHLFLNTINSIYIISFISEIEHEFQITEYREKSTDPKIKKSILYNKVKNAE
ncbi:hypothetical protein UT300006_14540 [Clostridium sp. CTA-6]